MNNSIIPAKFPFQGHNVRLIQYGNDTWFHAGDVMSALEYSASSRASKVCAHIPEIWKGVKPIHTPGGPQNALFLQEQGLYFFLGRSDKPKALPFQMWVYGEVLPSIRKTGSYSEPITPIPNREPSFDPLNHDAMRHAKEAAQQYFNDFRAGRQAGLDIPPEVLAGIVTEALQRNRMVVTFSQEGNLNARVIAHDKWIFSTAEFIKGIENGDVRMTSEQYARTAGACTTKLSGRVEHLEAKLTKPRLEPELRQRVA